VRIGYVAAGAAGMYCGTCLHDNTVAAALSRRGHDVSLIPTYTPLRTDEPDVSIDQVFYGAINVYLQEKVPLFRKTPRFLDRLLDGPGLLNQVSRFSSSTDAHELGALTWSVLQGETGHQSKELDRLVSYLEGFRPDVVHLTNSMFLGFAREIHHRTGAPVVCGLTGEDIFLEELDEPWRTRVHDAMKERAADAQGFIATSRYYADAMIDHLNVPPEKMHVVPLGISLADVEPRDGAVLDGEPFVIGYLARICPEKGLHLLLESFRVLAEERPGKVRLRVAGYVGGRDAEYYAAQKERVRDWGLEDSVEFLGEVERDAKLALLRSLDVLSVPSVYKEPKGRFVLEALAHAVPVVLPAHGAFPEMLEATGGGLLVDPESIHSLADGLRELANDRPRARRLGQVGREALLERFDDDSLAERTLGVYQGLVG
jgi:glycosyltransferase involved in cell wall biosynthesis